MLQYSTVMMVEAAGLQASGWKVTKLEPENGNIVRFLFTGLSEKEEKDIREHADAFWSDNLKVSAKKTCEAYKDLKSRLYMYNNSKQR